jgi:Ca-activated chloride channel family protein
VVFVPPATVRAQSAARDPITLFRAGGALQAARLWRQQIARGDKRPVTLFNYGTAMLAADSLDAAAEALERATLTPEAGVRQRALYNLGLTQLRRGLRGEGGDRRPLDAAISAYRALLLQRPDDADAKWNYELAMKLQQQSGGAGGRDDQQNPRQQQQQRPQPDEGRAMSRQQAEQLLASAARDEKETQANRQRGTRQEKPPGKKDW